MNLKTFLLTNDDYRKSIFELLTGEDIAKLRASFRRCKNFACTFCSVTDMHTDTIYTYKECCECKCFLCTRHMKLDSINEKIYCINCRPFLCTKRFKGEKEFIDKVFLNSYTS